MEQHPVPQNVTTFQFRLIGDMTIKQFGYLAGGAILGYICFKLPLPFIITWPLAIFSAIGGFGLAFIPVEERPMDIWVLSFIKSIYSPTQYIWTREQKTVVPIQPVPAGPATATQTITPPARPTPDAPPGREPFAPRQTDGSRPVEDVLRGVFNPSQPVPLKHARGSGDFLAWFAQMFSGRHSPALSHPTTGGAHYTTPSVTGRHIDLSPPPVVKPPPAVKPAKIAEAEHKEEELEHKMADLKKELETKTMTESRILELQKQLTEVLAQRDDMEKELTVLRRQASSGPSAMPPFSPPAHAPSPSAAEAAHIATPQAPKQPTVKIITQEGAIKAGLPRLTTFPNVVTGIIRDSENNFLPGVLVTVKDKDGVPLRALKTNRLGQFAASTPLANGVYFVEIEDPRGRYLFDRVQITLNGSIVPALEIVAKSQKELNRARLEREIFGLKT
jgi:hypothetical protein